MGFLEKVTSNQHLKAWVGEIPLENRYTFGIAGERFFRAIQERGEFLGTKCHRCSLTYLPPRIYCRRCFARLDDSWVTLPPQGKLQTFTVLHRDSHDHPYETPRILGVIQIDRSNGSLVHYVQRVDPKKVRIGMKLRSEFRPPSERTGSIHDIVGFVPA